MFSETKYSIMLTSLDALVKGYFATVEDSRKKCISEIDEIRKFVFDLNIHFFSTYKELLGDANFKRKIVDSLAGICFFELFRSSGHVVFFSATGLYRNAFDSIRHMIESIIQAAYLDTRHPDIDIETKTAILKEVEDKFEYHALRLIDSLDIDFKDRLKHEYRELSRSIHPSHKQIIATINDILSKPETFHVALVDCKEISRIYSSVKKGYDMFFYLFSVCHPEIRLFLKRNSEFLNDVKRFKLPLLASSLDIKL